VATARVYNDAGTSGTNGFTEDVVPVDEFFGPLDTSYFPIPSDLTNFRLNVGVRTLGAPVTLSIAAANSGGGAIVPAFNRDYPANTFTQVSLSDFLGGAAAPAGGSLAIEVISGNAIFYVSTTDNRTNDSSVRIGVRK